MANGEVPQSIKNLYVPITMVIGIIGIAIAVGMVQANVSQNGNGLERLEASVVPRIELDQRLGNIESDVSETKADVKELLRRKK